MPSPKLSYLDACHAIQTGVALDHGNGGTDGSPKHLRVGVNLTKCDHAALVQLLIAKGLFTEAEYVDAITSEANAEVDRYEMALGGKIKLR
jgi:hypothetical protein